MMMTLVFVVGAYLLGSVSFAVLMSKVFGLADPRTYGSGNPGATNVLRSGKKAAAALTLLGDAAKGWVAVTLAMQFAPKVGNFLSSYELEKLTPPHDEIYVVLVAAVALAVFLGHLFPIFLKFKGGKGVATALGVLLALSGWLGLAALATWLVMAVVFRYSSLSALAAAAGAPVYALLLGLPHEWVLASGIMSLLLIWRHKSNIMNLLAGKESRIGSKKSDSQSE
jgi:glycerol-3-phosphate acyltransferase PlsY